MAEMKMTAVIPVAQYANIQPEVTGVGETLETARDDALRQLQEIWAAVGEGGKGLAVRSITKAKLANSVTKTLICAFTGSEVEFDEANHVYSDGYLSGSAFASKFTQKFDADSIAPAFARRHGVELQDVLDMWAKNAEASTSFGTAVHAALELYGKYLSLSIATKGDDSSALHKNPVIAKIVSQFFAEHGKETAMYEPFVADESRKMCGFIDRLLVVDADKKIVRVQDYKTNPDIKKRERILGPFKGVVEDTVLGKYWLQLSFYAEILKAAGYTVQGLDIFNHNGTKWTTFTHDVVDITPGL